jgi:peptidoglycan/LPS O-acetylase OafA/YrhL
MRGLAALIVFLFHFSGSTLPVSKTGNIVIRTFSAFTRHDYLSVDVFFVLSGFLISSVLLDDKGNSHYFHNFYWRRALRILPVLLLALAMLWHEVHNSVRYILLCLLFVANFSNKFGVNFLTPFWTLCIEEQFYLVWPHFVRRSKTATLAWIAVGLIVISTLLRPLAIFLFSGPINFGYTYYRLDGLGFGSLAACAYMTEDQLTPGLLRILKVLENDTLLYISIAVLLILPVFPNFRYQELFSITISNFLTFRFLYAVVGKGRRFRTLASRPMLYMGSISYAFYLFQAFAIHHFLMRYGQPDLNHTWKFLGEGLLICGVTILLATASRYLVEKPAQHLRRWILARPADLHESLAIQVPPEKDYQPG